MKKGTLKMGKLPPDMLIRLLSKTAADESVLIGPSYGEDAAAVRFGGRVLVAASDPVTFTTDRIGYYAVSVNANDIAAHGAQPRYFLATILLPVGSAEADAEPVFNEIREACERIGVALIGGHTEITDSVNRVVVSGCMLGETDEKSLVGTAGARVGDALILAGGIAIEGTGILAREAANSLVAHEVILSARALLDDPGICVLEYARLAMAVGGVTSMHDPTEGGLATALRELAAASGTGLRIRRGSVLVLPECEAICAALGLDPLGLIASGSLLIAALPEKAEEILRAFRRAGISAAAIGDIVESSQGVKFDDGANLPAFDRDELARYFDKRQREV